MDQLRTQSLISSASADLREAPKVPTALFGLHHHRDQMEEVLSAPTVEEAQAIAMRRAQEAQTHAPQEPTEEDMRQQEADALTGYLARLGFPRENWEPEWGQLPEGWAGRCAAYHRDLPRYVANGVGMILSGERGSGKSCLLALIARAAEKHKLNCAYVLNGRTLLYQCQMVDRRAQTRASAYELLSEDADLQKHWPHERTPLVLLDEVDYIPAGGYDPERNAWDVIGAYLYARMARGYATCLASNLTPDQLLDRPGMDRVKDRATVYLPESLRLIAGRGTQRGEIGAA